MSRSFNGLTQYATIDTTFANDTSAFAFGGWIKTAGAYTAARAWLAFGSTSDNNPVAWIRQSDGSTPQLFVRASSTMESIIAIANPGGWCWMSGFVSRTVCQFRLNGMAGNLVTTDWSAQSFVTNNFTIGAARRTAVFLQSQATVAHVGVWDCASFGSTNSERNTAWGQIHAAIYAGAHPCDFWQGLRYYWPLDGIAASGEADRHPLSQGSLNHMTLTNSPTLSSDNPPVRPSLLYPGVI